MSAWDHSTRDLIGHLNTKMLVMSPTLTLDHEIGQALVIKLKRLQVLEEKRANDPDAWAEDDAGL